MTERAIVLQIGSTDSRESHPHETFESAIKTTAEQQKFQKSYRWTISSKFNALRDGLEYMIETKKLPKELHELVRSDLVGVFELIRRYRNSAGHPNLLSSIRRDTIFLNLAIFSEYIAQVYKLIEYFQSNEALIA